MGERTAENLARQAAGRRHVDAVDGAARDLLEAVQARDALSDDARAVPDLLRSHRWEISR